jgi:hypothetical protein
MGEFGLSSCRYDITTALQGCKFISFIQNDLPYREMHIICLIITFQLLPLTYFHMINVYRNTRERNFRVTVFLSIVLVKFFV